MQNICSVRNRLPAAQECLQPIAAYTGARCPGPGDHTARRAAAAIPQDSGVPDQGRWGAVYLQTLRGYALAIPGAEYTM